MIRVFCCLVPDVVVDRVDLVGCDLITSSKILLSGNGPAGVPWGLRPVLGIDSGVYVGGQACRV